MGDYTDIPRTSVLLDDELRGQIRGVFGKLTEDLEIVAIVDSAEEKSKELLSLLFDVETLGEHVSVRVYEKGEKYRVDAYWRKKVKYIWYTIPTADIKIYWQLRTVSYADYKVKKFYVSPYEIYQ